MNYSVKFNEYEYSLKLSSGTNEMAETNSIRATKMKINASKDPSNS